MLGAPGASHLLAPGDAERSLPLLQRVSKMPFGGARGHGHMCRGPRAVPGWPDPPCRASPVARSYLKP